MPFDLRTEINQSCYKFRFLAISVDMSQREHEVCVCVVFLLLQHQTKEKTERSDGGVFIWNYRFACSYSLFMFVEITKAWCIINCMDRIASYRIVSTNQVTWISCAIVCWILYVNLWQTSSHLSNVNYLKLKKIKRARGGEEMSFFLCMILHKEQIHTLQQMLHEV